MMATMARFILPDDERKPLERAAREVERLEDQLAEAKARRNGLVVAALQQHGEHRGAVSAVARYAGITPEAARRLLANPEAPWER